MKYGEFRRNSPTDRMCGGLCRLPTDPTFITTKEVIGKFFPIGYHWYWVDFIGASDNGIWYY